MRIAAHAIRSGHRFRWAGRRYTATANARRCSKAKRGSRWEVEIDTAERGPLRVWGASTLYLEEERHRQPWERNMAAVGPLLSEPARARISALVEGMQPANALDEALERCGFAEITEHRVGGIGGKKERMAMLTEAGFDCYRTIIETA